MKIITKRIFNKKRTKYQNYKLKLAFYFKEINKYAKKNTITFMKIMVS